MRKSYMSISPVLRVRISWPYVRIPVSADADGAVRDRLSFFEETVSGFRVEIAKRAKQAVHRSIQSTARRPHSVSREITHGPVALCRSWNSTESRPDHALDKLHSVIYEYVTRQTNRTVTDTHPRKSLFPAFTFEVRIFPVIFLYKFARVKSLGVIAIWQPVQRLQLHNNAVKAEPRGKAGKLFYQFLYRNFLFGG